MGTVTKTEILRFLEERIAYHNNEMDKLSKKINDAEPKVRASIIARQIASHVDKNEELTFILSNLS